MSAVISRQIDLFSKQKLLHTSSFGRIFARFEGSANFSVSVETDEAAVELKLGKEAELKIDDYLFGSGGAFSFSGDDCKFSLGNDYVNVSFNPLSLSGVTVIIPAKVSAIKLESAFPSLGLKGTAAIDIELIITYLPDYKKLRKVVNAKNIRAVIQIAKDQLTKSIAKSKSVVRLALKYGRAALNAPLKMIGNSIGRRLAIDSIKLGSQVAALKKLIGLGGRLLFGVAGIIIDTRLSVKAAVPGVIAYQHKQVWKVIIPAFANAYAEFLASMTDPTVLLADYYFDLKKKIKRPLATVPDLYAVAETLSGTGQVTYPSVNAGDWVKEYLKNPITTTYEDSLASIEWQALFREAYNLYFLFMDVALHSS
ncbi:MAG TPA: hypothetical protein DHV26_06845, partial [Cytophagales bacterium]|nr:hypothetical protein [Cytophagales bacterium]